MLGPLPWIEPAGNLKVMFIGIGFCHLITDTIAFTLAFLGCGIGLQQRHWTYAGHCVQENDDQHPQGALPSDHPSQSRD